MIYRTVTDPAGKGTITVEEVEKVVRSLTSHVGGVHHHASRTAATGAYTPARNAVARKARMRKAATKKAKPKKRVAKKAKPKKARVKKAAKRKRAAKRATR